MFDSNRSSGFDVSARTSFRIVSSSSPTGGRKEIREVVDTGSADEDRMARREGGSSKEERNEF